VKAADESLMESGMTILSLILFKAVHVHR
jgi:hypothetical protein